jgi:hypothetical protein
VGDGRRDGRLGDGAEVGCYERALMLREHLKRRTFAIISHPDAGKTTLT